MIILGLNAFHGDASAALIINGDLVCAVEEERLSRVKHEAGFPSKAVALCLNQAGLSIEDVDVVAVNRDPSVNFLRKMVHVVMTRFKTGALIDRLRNASKLGELERHLNDALGHRPSRKSKFPRVVNVEHHRAHLSSAYHVSGFEAAAVVSVDGFGDFASSMWGLGQGSNITVLERICFPHSLGLFYTAVTQYLGFPHYGDEYKVMGLAPYGSPSFMKEMRSLVRLRSGGRFELGLQYFTHHSEGVPMTWSSGEPVVGCVYSNGLVNLLGPARDRDEPLTQRHRDIAASAQAMYEEAFFHILNHVQRVTGQKHLALAGGCAMNSVANGKIFANTKFKDVYVQSAAGDAGGAIGAAYSVWHDSLKMSQRFHMKHAYWGPSFTDEQIKTVIDTASGQLFSEHCSVEKIENISELYVKTAKAISDGLVIGWFQGRMEWGPRALGNRSILGDPRRADMKDILNLKIKRRESFRPFAPSILRENVKDWFETDYDVPFMLQVFQIMEHKRALIPAVTHVNGSGRLQTVTVDQNERYYGLISAFRDLTGVPMLLNTSFNENEPVVCKPEEALNCFLRTKMDVLVLGDYYIHRASAA